MLIDIIKKMNFQNKKVLYIPSAGKAQRNLYYFKKGKIWIPVQKRLEGKKSSTIFDEIMINTYQILERMNEGILICCSDVVVLFGEKIQKIDSNNILVFTTKEDVKKGTKHGVFKLEGEKVIETFQKKDEKFLEDHKAIDNGKINIDTGMILLPISVIKKLKKVKFKSKNINLYDDILSLFTKEDTNIKKYMTPELKNNFESIGIKAIKLENSKFIHFGTSNEILQIKMDSEGLFKKIGWNNNMENYNIKDESYLENTIDITKNKKVMLFNSIVTTKLPENTIMYTARLGKNKWVSIIYGINDDIKAEGDKATILSKSLKKFVEEQQIFKGKISLWETKLFIPGKTKETASKNAVNLYSAIKNNEKINLKNALSVEEILKKEK